MQLNQSLGHVKYFKTSAGVVVAVENGAESTTAENIRNDIAEAGVTRNIKRVNLSQLTDEEDASMYRR